MTVLFGPFHNILQRKKFCICWFKTCSRVNDWLYILNYLCIRCLRSSQDKVFQLCAYLSLETKAVKSFPLEFYMISKCPSEFCKDYNVSECLCFRNMLTFQCLVVFSDSCHGNTKQLQSQRVVSELHTPWGCMTASIWGNTMITVRFQ